MIVPAALIVLPSLLIAGWWYARNYILYGDPTGLNVWLKISGGRQAPVTLPGLLGEFQGFRISYWGNFGGVNLIAEEWVYTVLDVILVVAAIGLLTAVWRRRIPAAIWIPAFWLLIIFATLVRWTLLTSASQGRLIFPAISAVSVLIAFGLSNIRFGASKVLGFKLLAPASNQPVNTAAVLFLLGFAVASPFLIIVPAYTPPARLAGDAQPPNPVHITYEAGDDRPELAGYEIGRSVRTGDELPLTLYWRTGGGVSEDLYVYIHLYDASGDPVGQWDALPGNGLYPTRLWQPDQSIVDRYRVPISTGALGPQVGHVEVGLTRVGSTVPLLARNPGGQTIVPTIARFKIAAPSRIVAARPALFKFGGEFDAVNVHISGARGGRVFEIDPGHTTSTSLFGGDVLRTALTLRAVTAPAIDYTVFVHLIDANNHIVLQQDAPPGGSTYPTSFWDAGEEVDGQFDLRIPDTLAPGDYQLEVGVYDSKDESRLPVSGDAMGSLRAAGDRLLLTPLSIGK